MTNKLLGIHHVTAMTDDIKRNYKWMTEVLGMRLVKKTVNQDDIHTYHTFYADDKGTPGTDLTFFDFPNIPSSRKGTNSISEIGLRVPSDEALQYYSDRFREFDVKQGQIEELFGHQTLAFEESDGQKYRLFSDEKNSGIPAGQPWKEGPVPTEYAINGLGPIEITVTYFEEFKEYLTKIYQMREVVSEEAVSLFEVGKGGHGGQVILRKDTTSPEEIQGDGGVHHVSFRVKDEVALKEWYELYTKIGLWNSGIVERYYFKALYARIGHILIEISTDGPGFMTDEPYETLGEILSLPDFLEPQRKEIEASIRPFDTTRIK